jgi:hypothetical protein
MGQWDHVNIPNYPIGRPVEPVRHDNISNYRVKILIFSLYRGLNLFDLNNVALSLLKAPPGEKTPAL